MLVFFSSALISEFFFHQCKKSCALKWKAAKGNCNWCEADAVKGGYDYNGECLFVGRAVFCGDLTPGKVVVSHGCCIVGYGGKERQITEYEYLLKTSCPFKWVKSCDGCVPSNAVEGGHTACGEPLYVGRCFHNGAQIIGKIQASFKGILIPFGGIEVKHCHYEVLTLATCGDCCIKSESVC